MHGNDASAAAGAAGGDAARSGTGGPRDASAPVYAAIDLGTNNCRLLVAKPVHRGFRVIDAFSRIVRLGEGLSRSDALSDAAIERTVEALRICGRKMERRGVTMRRAVATEACRRASNRRQFIDIVSAETGIDLEIISSEEEGRLALAGSAPLLDRRLPYALVFDIGGGSTELMWIRLSRHGRPELVDQISIPCGVVALSERFGGERVHPSAYAAMIVHVAERLSGFEARNLVRAAVDRGLVQMLGTSGTVTTLAGINMGLPRYDRAKVDGSHLDTADARRVTRELLALDLAERAAHPCIGPERADLVLAGCAVLEAIVDLWPVRRLRIADRGLREGILWELMASADGRRRDAPRCPA